MPSLVELAAGTVPLHLMKHMHLDRLYPASYFTADTDTSRSAHVTEPVAAPVRQNCLQALAGENTSPQIGEKSGGRITGVRQHALISHNRCGRLATAWTRHATEYRLVHFRRYDVYLVTVAWQSEWQTAAQSVSEAGDESQTAITFGRSLRDGGRSC